MSTKTLWLPGRVPEFNELIAAAKIVVVIGRKRITGSAYNKLKGSIDDRVKVCAESQGFVIPDGATCWTFLFVRENRRHDPDNISSGGGKICMDALQRCDVLGNDGWKQVTEIRHHFMLGQPGVLVAVSDRTFGFVEMFDLLGASPYGRVVA